MCGRLLLLALFGCDDPGTISIGGDDTGTPDLGDADTDTDSDTDTDTDTDLPVGDLFADLTWRLHEDQESLAYVSWTQAEAATVHVEYSFDEGVWLSSPPFAAAAGPNEQLVVGIPYETEAAWRLVSDGGSSLDGEPITTADLPRTFPAPEVELGDQSKWIAGGNYLLTSINSRTGGWTGGNYYTFIVDRMGRIVWARLTPEQNWTLFAQVALSGDHILWDEATYWNNWDDGAGSTVHRGYLDEEIETIETPGLHHAWVQLPGDTLVWGSQDHGGGEALVERGPTDDDERIIWTCRGNWPGSEEDQGCESNGIYYSPERDSFLYSFYTNNSLVEVDHVTGESLWWAGEVADGYSFTPSDSQFSWQHGVSWTAAGTLLVSTYYEGEGSRGTTAAVEYDVDRSAGTLTPVWVFDPGVHADTNGDAWRLENGNTLHVVGSSGHLYEVDPDGEVLWHLDFDGTHLLGRGEFIEDLYALVSPR
ncbi:MAG: hypothetical protein Q8P18_17840 [Pseudomonadota bacterium]|nr:hypothetical protein [Pseudomonadota bacterium]